MRWFKKTAVCLLAGILLMCNSGCGASKDSAQVAEAYAAQRSVTCTVQYHATLDAVIDGVRFKDLEQKFTGDAQVDLTLGKAYLLGELETLSSGERLGSIQVETYALPEDGEANAFYRFGAAYYADSQECAPLSFINAPLTLNLSSGYQRQAATEICFGAECDVYTGHEVAGDSRQSFLLGQTRAEFSLEGCLMDVTLRAYADTSLPAHLEITYSNLDEMEVSFSDSLGNTYTITSLHFEVLYNSYGTPVEVEIPDGFRKAALSGESGQTPVQPLNPDGSTLEELLGGTVTGFTGDPDAGFNNSYFIFNETSSYFFAIRTPEYMELDIQERDQVRFYYFYADDDFELINYCLYSDSSFEDEVEYAKKLPTTLRKGEGFSNVSGGDIQSITIGDYEINYTITSFTLEAEDEVYDSISVYSWMAAPNGKDCLGVRIDEYNASGDGVFFNPVEELQYAYASILGGGAFRAD